jgi:pyruvate dehydrogenase (quinone)
MLSMSGAGGLGMLLGELLTVAKFELPVKIVTFNNSALGMVKLEMLVDGLPDYQTDNGGFDYSAIAQGVGIHSVRVEQPTDVRDGLSEAFAHRGRALVDRVTDPTVLSIPPRITAAEVKGFALAAGKLVLDGRRGDGRTGARISGTSSPWRMRGEVE